MEPTTSVAPKIPGLFSLMKESFSFYKKHFRQLVLVGLVPFVTFTIIGILLSVLEPSSESTTGAAIVFGILAILSAIINFVMQTTMQVAFIKSIQRLDAGEAETPVKELYLSSLKMFGSALWISILSALIFFGCSIFFLIPGLIVAVFTYFALFALVLDGNRGLQAISASFYYVRENWWKVFGRALGWAAFCLILLAIGFAIIIWIASISGLNLQGTPAEWKTIIATFQDSTTYFVLSAVISLVWICAILPIGQYYFYSIYKSLKLRKTAPVTETDFKSSRPWFLGLSIWGLIVGILLMVFAVIFPIALGLVGARDRGRVEMLKILPETFTEMAAYPPGNMAVLESKAYINKDLGFSIHFPKGWTPQDSPEDGGILARNPGEKLEGVMEVQFFDAKVTSDDVARQVARQVLEDTGGIKKIDLSKFMLEGKLTYKVSAAVVSIDGERTLEYYFITNDRGTHVITTTWMDSSTTAKSLIADSISSFKAIN